VLIKSFGSYWRLCSAAFPSSCENILRLGNGYTGLSLTEGHWCLLFVLIRQGNYGGRTWGGTSLHAGLEHLGKETVEPTGPLGPTP